MRASTLTIAASLAVTTIAGASELELYAVDFAPPQPLFQAPLTGAGPATRTTISSVEVGNPVVTLNSHGMDRPVIFDTLNGADEIRLDLDDLPQGESYTLAFDVNPQIVGAGATFHVKLDAGFAGWALQYYSDNHLRLFIPGQPIHDLGPYAFANAMHVEWTWDYVTNSTEVKVDGFTRYKGSLNDPGAFNGVTFETSPDGSGLLSVGVDNIHVVADVPCFADATGDGLVDTQDLIAVIGDWGVCGGESCPSDLNGDGMVDVSRPPDRHHQLGHELLRRGRHRRLSRSRSNAIVPGVPDDSGASGFVVSERETTEDTEHTELMSFKQSRCVYGRNALAPQCSLCPLWFLLLRMFRTQPPSASIRARMSRAFVLSGFSSSDLR